MHNSDLGRWFQPDPKGQFYSPYISMGNNPVSGVDPDGGYMYDGANSSHGMGQGPKSSGLYNGGGLFSDRVAAVEKYYWEEVAKLNYLINKEGSWSQDQVNKAFKALNDQLNAGRSARHMDADHYDDPGHGATGSDALTQMDIKAMRKIQHQPAAADGGRRDLLDKAYARDAREKEAQEQSNSLGLDVTVGPGGIGFDKSLSAIYLEGVQFLGTTTPVFSAIPGLTGTWMKNVFGNDQIERLMAGPTLIVAPFNLVSVGLNTRFIRSTAKEENKADIDKALQNNLPLPAGRIIFRYMWGNGNGDNETFYGSIPETDKPAWWPE